MAAAAFLAGYLPCSAQESRFPARTHRIAQIAAEVRVDGRLDEAAWSQAQPITDFVQTEPDEGAPASERTEAYLFYDRNKIYLGFKCYESEPKKIIARLATHDARTHSDSVNIFLDPYGDRRTGYFFSINARGVQFDGPPSSATTIRSASPAGRATWATSSSPSSPTCSSFDPTSRRHRVVGALLAAPAIQSCRSARQYTRLHGRPTRRALTGVSGRPRRDYSGKSLRR